MTPRTLHAVADADGLGALPRRNGELVFDAPWQSRAFGVAIALHDAGAIDYEAFRARLIDEIAGHGQRDSADEGAGGYYEHWLDALEHVLEQQEIVSAEELEARAADIAHAWDHDHGHDHSGGAGHP